MWKVNVFSQMLGDYSETRVDSDSAAGRVFRRIQANVRET